MKGPEAWVPHNKSVNLNGARRESLCGSGLMFTRGRLGHRGSVSEAQIYLFIF